MRMACWINKAQQRTAQHNSAQTSPCHLPLWMHRRSLLLLCDVRLTQAVIDLELVGFLHFWRLSINSITAIGEKNAAYRCVDVTISDRASSKSSDHSSLVWRDSSLVAAFGACRTSPFYLKYCPQNIRRPTDLLISLLFVKNHRPCFNGSLKNRLVNV